MNWVHDHWLYLIDSNYFVSIVFHLKILDSDAKNLEFTLDGVNELYAHIRKGIVC